ncbi:MAG: class II fumarate hydratase [Chlamydiales bacterium]
MKKRIETDGFGEIEVPARAYYGPQTARSLVHFNIGSEKMPSSFIRAYGLLKRACAEANCELGFLDEEKKRLIVQAADEVIAGRLYDHFPLSIWQTGSGTQTNMNVNEVIANRATELAGLDLGDRSFIHPNDDVNRSQSTNDSFPTAMSIAAVKDLQFRLLPMLRKLYEALIQKGLEFRGIVKVGRTHLMDATPLTLEQEFSGYIEQLTQNIERIEGALPRMYELAIGGTAVGTGLNTPPGFAELVVNKICVLTGLPFTSAKNKFAALACHDPLVFMHSAIKTLACSLMKISSDLSWMVSGPRAGLAELKFAANEPGSSIMPGKVNPTQCEAMTMVCVHVIGNDTAIACAGSMGNFELNVFKPMLIHSFLNSVELISDVCRSFAEYFVKGLVANTKQIKAYLERSLMFVTALNPKIGYDKAAAVAKKAYQENISLKESCLSLGFLSEEEFDQVVDPQKMV